MFLKLLTWCFRMSFEPKGLILGWSTCQADYCSSGEEEEVEDDVGDYPSEEDEEFDNIYTSDNEEVFEKSQRTKLSKREALEVLKRENGNKTEAVEIIMKTLFGDNLEELSSQAARREEKLSKQILNKLTKLEKASKARKFRHKEEELNDTFENVSQCSLKDLMKSKKEDVEEKNYNKTEIKQKPKYREPLNKCKNMEHVKERTSEVMKMIKAEAEEQMITPTSLLALLMYRENYVSKRNFALKMLKLYKEDRLEVERVGVEKALALLERRRLGKGGYRYLKRHLRPHGVVLPSYPEVAALRSTLVCPPLQQYLSPGGQVVGVTIRLASCLETTFREC